MRHITKIETAVFVAAFGSGLVGGVFYGFSTYVMGALHVFTPSAGIAAMQSINVVVKNVPFCGFLFGLVRLCAWIAFTSLTAPSPELASRLRTLAALIYIVGCIGVTFVRNVPRNDALALVGPQSTDGAALWSSFLPSWTFWNHVRCGTCCLSCVLFMISLAAFQDSAQ